MRSILSVFLLTFAVHFSIPATRAQSILENGNFDNPTDPLKGWISDYGWTNNSYYVGNKDHVSVVSDGARKSVVKFTAAGEGGVKLESRPFPIEPGFKYVCTLDIKAGGYRLCIAGYQWAPGVHPHDNPELGELRMVYQSKATTGSSTDWKRETMELPGVKLSEEGIAHLKKIRYLTVWIYIGKAGEISNVALTKVADPAMKF